MMRWFSFCLYIVIFDTNGFIVPDEIPTALSVIYSNIPKIKLGSDSRIGWGFRLGDNVDAQVLLELGPQHYTQPLANQQPFDNPNYPELSSSLDTEDYDDIQATPDDQIGTQEEIDEKIDEEGSNKGKNQRMDGVEAAIKIEIEAMENLRSKLNEKGKNITSTDQSEAGDREHNVMNTLMQMLEVKINQEKMKLKNIEESTKIQLKQDEHIEEKGELKGLIMKLKAYIEKTSSNQGSEIDEVAAIEIDTLKQLIQRLHNLTNQDGKKEHEEIDREKLVNYNMKNNSQMLNNEEKNNNSVIDKLMDEISVENEKVNSKESNSTRIFGKKSIETEDLFKYSHEIINLNETIIDVNANKLLKVKLDGEKSRLDGNTTKDNIESRMIETESATLKHNILINITRNLEVDEQKEHNVETKEEIRESKSSINEKNQNDSSWITQYKDDNIMPATATTIIKFEGINKDKNTKDEIKTESLAQGIYEHDNGSEKLVNYNMKNNSQMLNNEEKNNNSVIEKLMDEISVEDEKVNSKDSNSTRIFGKKSIETEDLFKYSHEIINLNKTIIDVNANKLLKVKLDGEKSRLDGNTTKDNIESRMIETESATLKHNILINITRNLEAEEKKEHNYETKEEIRESKSSTNGKNQNDSSWITQYKDDNIMPATATSIIKFEGINKDKNTKDEIKTESLAQGIYEDDNGSEKNNQKHQNLKQELKTRIQLKEETETKDATTINSLKISDAEITSKIDTTEKFLDSNSSKISININNLQRIIKPIIELEKLSTLPNNEEEHLSVIKETAIKNSFETQVNVDQSQNLKINDEKEDTKPINQEERRNGIFIANSSKPEEHKKQLEKLKKDISKNRIHSEETVENLEKKGEVSPLFKGKELKKTVEVNVSRTDEAILEQSIQKLKVKLDKQLKHLGEMSESQKQEIMQKIKILRILTEEKKKKSSEKSQRLLKTKHAHNSKDGFIFEGPYRGVKQKAFEVLSSLWIEKDTDIRTIKTAGYINNKIKEDKSERVNNDVSTIRTQEVNMDSERNKTNVKQLNKNTVLQPQADKNRWKYSAKIAPLGPQKMTNREVKNLQKPLGGRIMAYISKILQGVKRRY